MGGRTRGGQRGGDLVRDVTALSHTGHDDSARHAFKQVDGLNEAGVKFTRQRLEPGNFDVEDATGCLQGSIF